MKKLLVQLLFFVFVLTGQSVALPPSSFSKAKRLAMEIFKDNPETLYCQCRFDSNKQINLASCNMQDAGTIERALRVEFEHIMPAYQLGQHFRCWTEAICTNSKGKKYRGRKCCRAVNRQFRAAEAELYNLWPSVGLINQLRSNFDYDYLHHQYPAYGCDFKYDNHMKKAEPGNLVKGLVARASLFMAEQYQIPMSEEQRQLFLTWHQQYPVTSWEIEWSRQVAEIEGYSNPWIS